jgi:hypothetical protein
VYKDFITQDTSQAEARAARRYDRTVPRPPLRDILLSDLTSIFLRPTGLKRPRRAAECCSDQGSRVDLGIDA